MVGGEKKEKNLEIMAKDKERQLFQIAVSIWYFAAGADRSSVIPTVNEYLMSLGADQVRVKHFYLVESYKK